MFKQPTKFLKTSFSKAASFFFAFYLLFSPALILATSNVLAEDTVNTNVTVIEEDLAPETDTNNQTDVDTAIEEEINKEVNTPQETVIEGESQAGEEIENTQEENSTPVQRALVSVNVVKESDGDLTTSVIESQMCLANSLNACVVTDKGDYAPTDIVTLNGAGYSANSEYKLVIYSSNEPAVRFETTITTDNNGSFNHSYQLDGVYRPNYTVEVYSVIASELPVASTTFTDAPGDPVCGNSVLEEGEQCDGTLGLEGYNNEITCSRRCEFDLVEEKVDICHSTDSHTNPYISHSPNKSGDVHGHDDHDGIIWYEGIADHSWGDVIPPFWYIDESKDAQYYEGKNWTEEGQSLLTNGCSFETDEDEDDDDEDDEPGTIRVYKNVVYGNTSLEIYSDEMFSAVLGSEGDEYDMKDMSDRSEPIVAEYTELYPALYTVTEYTEEMPTGYNFLGCKVRGSDNELQSTVDVDLDSGEVVEIECINQVEARLQLTKSNNTGGADLYPGTKVLYTLVVSAPNTNDREVPYVLNAVKVVDVTPAGIDYNGIWNAVLNRNGENYDLKALGLINEPTYNSPGTWDLSQLDESFGGFIEGDVVTFTYGATISLDQDPGLYKDLAWTQGNNVLGMRVVGSAPIADVFAGTEVSVIATPSDADVTIENLSATLPNTGANWILTVFGVLSAVAGVVLLFLTKKPSKKLLSFIFAFGLLLTLFSVSKIEKAYAGSNYIRLETPKSPTGNVNTKLGFVTLDIDDNATTVTCSVRALGGTFAVFDTVTVTGEGNNGNCTLNNSILSQPGTYEFQATSGSATSEIVSMTFDNKGPLPVVDYSKTKGVCTYKLDFKTGNDAGETILVQIFRSEKKSFEANNSTKVKEITIGSNESATYVDSVPECGTEYYYAVRAVDNANNTSEIVADKTVIVTQAPIVQNENDSDVQGEQTENEDNNDDGDVKGDEDKGSDDQNGNTNDNDERESDKNDDKDVNVWDWFKYVLLATVIVGAGYGIYLYVKQRKPRVKSVKAKKKSK